MTLTKRGIERGADSGRMDVDEVPGCVRTIIATKGRSGTEVCRRALRHCFLSKLLLPF